MNERQRAILNAVEKFRALSRVHIETMFFERTKNAKNNANNVLKKLCDRGYLVQNKAFQPFVYHVKGTKLKANGQKVSQYLQFADVYLEMVKHGSVKQIDIEPRYQNVEVRPDMFAIWKGSLWFIECQNSTFSEKQITEKIQRYEKLLISGQYKQLPFQKYEKHTFPFVLIIGEGVPYSITSKHVRIFQAKSIDEFMATIERNKQPKAKTESDGVIRWKIG